MNHSGKMAGLAVAAVALTLTGCSSDANATKTVQLSYASFVDERNPHSRAFQAWADEVTARTNGAVTFEAHYSSALCAAGEIISCVANGTADMGFSPAGYEPAVLPISTFTSIGFVTRDLQAQADAATVLFEESADLKKEWERVGIQPIFHTPSNPYVVATSKELSSLSDFSDLSLRASGDGAIALNELGANPVAMSIAESYESIERGVISGINTSIDGLATSRIYEVAPKIYDVGEFWGNGMIMHTMINKSVWDGLDPETQEIMEETAKSVSGKFVQDYSIPGAEADCKVLFDAGARVHSIGPEDEGSSWAASAQDAQIGDWMKNGGSALQDPSSLINEFKKLVAERANETDSFSPAGTCKKLQDK